jgi:hypothetical protein
MAGQNLGVDARDVGEDDMKRSIYATLGAALLMFGCANLAEDDALQADTIRTTGWITFVGEARLYDQQSDLGKLYTVPCWSVVLSRNAKRRSYPRYFEGMHVSVRGQFIPAESQTEGPPPLSTSITGDYCNRGSVLLAEELEIIDDRP